MKTVYYELSCSECGSEYQFDDEYDADDFCECPECGNKHLWREAYIVCDCGNRVNLTGSTNECDSCGVLYNRFGQELAPIDDWCDDYYGGEDIW